ncbi:ribosome small subunit-dependent GTPase A [Shouchella patagoniensis]|uniref:ribosome small subunit-dependent GTPase A n=1 Tax=Shouchella patagoniensis TaxID=228576 RepID=UPI0009953A52|nr:ribosome small subunit-dependent GTPase A [Shouchella patagoniensis]
MPEGLIVKALSGFYYVKDDSRIVQCRARGVFRKKKLTPLVGDYVGYEAENDTEGYIMVLKERKNELVRPPIANVDQALLVFSAKEPEFSFVLLDRFLVHIEHNDVIPLIIVSKTDLVSEDERKQLLKKVHVYKKIGYDVLLTSTEKEDDPTLVLPWFKGNVTVIAGQSGVGKSSLLNALIPNSNIETNAISKHLGRGRHTTRHVELLEIGGGLVADTPGFSSLDFIGMEAEDLRFCFPEFVQVMDACKFRGCLHDKEPGCAVKQAVSDEEIADTRHANYLQFLNEIQNQKRRY